MQLTLPTKNESLKFALACILKNTTDFKSSIRQKNTCKNLEEFASIMKLPCNNI
jgi:hypothetical protein